MATACSEHCQLISQSSGSNQSSVLDSNSILDNVLCTFVGNYVELLAAVENLKEVLANNPNVISIIYLKKNIVFLCNIYT